MKIAVPVVGDKLCLHFGHCEKFAMVDVDTGAKTILKREDVVPPPHQPGVLPGWLHDQGAEMIFAGGMGVRAQDLFTQMGIKVMVGAPPATPEEVINAWLDGTLNLGDNVCDH